jgi:asparagine synthase (glutamine-hydrolysing)
MEFWFYIYDVEKDEYFIARDHMGIIPLYIGWDEHGTFYVASELKALEGYCTKNTIVSSWTFYDRVTDGEFVQWYKETGLTMML